MPITSALDDFNSGANQLLTARTGWSSSAVWSAGEISLITDATPTEANSSNTNATAHSNFWATSFAADQEVWFTYGSVIDDVRLLARGAALSSGGTTVYDLLVRWNGVGLALERDATTLKSLTRAAPVTGETYVLQVIGNGLLAWRQPPVGEPELLLTASDANFTNDGFIGLHMGPSVTGAVTAFGGGAISGQAGINLQRKGDRRA